MYPTELTPLNPIHHSPRNVKNRKCIANPSILTALAAIIICICYYTGFILDHSESENITKNTLLGHQQTEHNNNTITQLHEITIHLHPKDIYYLETLDRNSTEYKDYHLILIEIHGYNPLDESVIYTFTMHDYHYEKEHYYAKYLRAHNEGHDEPINIKTPRPTLLKTLRPTIPPKTPRPTTSKTSRPTTIKTSRPTISKTYRPTIPKYATPKPTTSHPTTHSPTNKRIAITPKPTIYKPTIHRTSKPTILRTSKPTILRTSKPSTLRTNRPTSGENQKGRPTLPPNTDRPTELHTLRPTNPPKRTPYPTPDTGMSSRHVVKGGLKCYAKYALNEKVNAGGYILKCNEEHDVLVGCVSGSTHRPKAERSGEKPMGNGCSAIGEAIYIRCCQADDININITGKVSVIEYEQDAHFPVYSLKSWCQNTDVNVFNQLHMNDLSETNTTYYLTGCTAYFGLAHPFNSSIGSEKNTLTSKSIGTKVMRNVCRTKRGDKRGFVAAPIIAMGLDNKYELDCKICTSSEAHQPKNSVVHGSQDVPEWAAMSFCSAGYSLMDCNGYIVDSIDECLNEPNGTDRVRAVLFHGTDMKCMPDAEQHCSANGNSDKIRVQATCCRIIMRGDNSTVNITDGGHDHSHGNGEHGSITTTTSNHNSEGEHHDENHNGESITTTSVNEEHHNEEGHHGEEHHEEEHHEEEHHEGSMTTTSMKHENEHHEEEHHEGSKTTTSTRHENEHHGEEHLTTSVIYGK